MNALPIEEFISSLAKLKTLSTLYASTLPVSVRQIAYRSGAGLRSVQLALSFLEKSDVLRKTKHKNRVFFHVNPKHKHHVFLKSMFSLMKSESIRQSAAHWTEKAKKVTSAIDSMHKTFTRARKTLFS